MKHIYEFTVNGVVLKRYRRVSDVHKYAVSYFYDLGGVVFISYPQLTRYMKKSGVYNAYLDQSLHIRIIKQRVF